MSLNRVHDALLHHKFDEVIELLLTLTTNTPSPSSVEHGDISPLTSSLLGTPVRATSRCNNVVTFTPVTQHSHRAAINAGPITHAVLKWKQWLIKCVDASPLVIETTQQKCVVIGSHSGHVTCMELQSGEFIWRTQLPDRVESSATLIKVQNQFYICVGKCTNEHQYGSLTHRRLLRSLRLFSGRQSRHCNVVI